MPGVASGVFNQLAELAGLAVPLISVGQRFLATRDGFPAIGARQFGVDGDEFELLGRQVLFGINGVGRTFGDANRAIYAFLGIDHQKVRAFSEAVYGADINAVGVLALDAVLGNDMGHDGCKQNMCYSRLVGTAPGVWQGRN